MNDDIQQTPSAPTTTEGTTATPQPSTAPTLFTQEDVNRFVAAERRNYQTKLQEAQAQLEQVQKSPKAKSEEPTIAQLREELHQERNARLFAEATAGKQLDAKQRAVLRKLFDSDSPEDPIAWADEYVSVFATAAPIQTPVPSTPVQPATMPAATAASNLEHFEVPPQNLTREQIARLGPGILDYVRGWNKRHGK